MQNRMRFFMLGSVNKDGICYVSLCRVSMWEVVKFDRDNAENAAS